MARDRQRAKQRQAERRARRLAEERGSGRAQPQDAGGRGRAEQRQPEDSTNARARAAERELEESSTGRSRAVESDDSPTGRARAAKRHLEEASAAQAGAAEPDLDEPAFDGPRDGDGQAALDDPRAAPPAPGIGPSLAVGAPPQDEGRSDRVVEDEPYLDDRYTPGEDYLRDDEHVEDEEYLDEEEIAAAEEAESELAGAGEAGYEARGRRGVEDVEAHKERARVVQFLIAVRAELQRVQWPDRQALTTLTGVVLGFVLIAGGYLGLLDAIFSEIIKAII